MQIILQEDDLKEAMTNHLSTIGMNMSGKEIDVTFTAGRGINGYSATISISNTIGSKPVPVQRAAPFKTEPDTDVDGTEAGEIDDPTPADTDNVFASNG